MSSETPQAPPPPPAPVERGRQGAGSRLLSFVLERLRDTDDEGAIRRANDLRAAYPDWPVDRLAGELIARKCRQTAAIGAATAGAGVVPGLGTIAALTVGAIADAGATLRLQIELVVEIAAAHGRRLTEEEKQRAVLLISGVTVGGERLLSRGGASVSLRLTERYTQRWIARAIPFAGIAASAALNATTTYLIGQRAHTYFGLGPDAVGSWAESVRALSGVDERRIAAAVTGWAGDGLRRVRQGAQSLGPRLSPRARVEEVRRRLTRRPDRPGALPPPNTLPHSDATPPSDALPPPDKAP